MADERYKPGRKVMENLEKFIAWSECYSEAVGLIKNQEFEEAIPILVEAERRIDANKTVFRAQIAERMAYCFHQLAKFEEAQRDYEQALLLTATPLDEQMFELKGTENLRSPEERRAAASVQAELYKQRDKSRLASKKVIASVLDEVERNYGSMLLDLGKKDECDGLSRRVVDLRIRLLQ
jgi:tetratricopeptide (TPR) repeat protein